MSLSLGLKVANSLSLTPQLQQAIRLLQLSALELEQEIQEQLDSNPLLEKLEDEFGEQLTAPGVELDGRDSANTLGEASEFIPTELPVDTNWDDIYTHQSTALATPEFEEREDNRTHSETLSEHLLWQINLLHFTPTDRVIAECLVDALDERGYLAAGIDEIIEAANHMLQAVVTDPDAEAIEAEEVLAVLKLIQRLDPVGVAARDLSECLQLQLSHLPPSPLHQAAQRLLQHRDLLLSHDLNRLMKVSQLSLNELKQAMALLKSLDPAPGSQFQEKFQDYQIPDVVLQKKHDRWQVFLNPDILPRLRVNPYYAGLIQRGSQTDDNQYLKSHLQDARNFIKSIDERHKTLLKVASCIAEHQREFFEIGPEAMKPLILREVADEVELHESTVSRVTTNKYMLTPRGLFELKYFFSSHVATASGGECSSTAIRAMIKKIIQSENPQKPYSDNALTQMLQDEGIDVARRTVAKYRESLNIPSSSERKMLF